METITRTDERTTTLELERSGPGSVAHIVFPKSAITEAYVMGTPVEALCGHVFTPCRDPKSLPKCTRCVEIYNTGAFGVPSPEGPA